MQVVASMNNVNDMNLLDCFKMDIAKREAEPLLRAQPVKDIEVGPWSH